MEQRPGTVLAWLLHAFVGWAGCGVAIGLGLALTSEQTALIFHALFAPVWFGLVSWRWFSRYRGYGPLGTAVRFTGFVIAVDLVVVAGMIQGSLEMFRSFLGTWLVFALIFASTWAVGSWMRAR